MKKLNRKFVFACGAFGLLSIGSWMLVLGIFLAETVASAIITAAIAFILSLGASAAVYTETYSSWER